MLAGNPRLCAPEPGRIRVQRGGDDRASCHGRGDLSSTSRWRWPTPGRRPLNRNHPPRPATPDSSAPPPAPPATRRSTTPGRAPATARCCRPQPPPASRATSRKRASRCTASVSRCARPTASYFITSSVTGKPQEHRVEYTLGSRRIQHYLTTIDKGMIVVLPPTWDVQRREWLHNMDIVRPDENHQRPVQQWNKDCVGCHVSEQDNNYRPATGEYATTWRDFGTSCERCHGPGRAHVDAYRRADGRTPAAASSIVRPTRLDAATSSMICAQCHSLRNAIDPGYQAGRTTTTISCRASSTSRGPGLDVAVLARRPPAAILERCDRPLAERVFPARAARRAPAVTRIRTSPTSTGTAQLAASNNALCTGCHQQIGDAARGAHASPRHERGQLVRRVPHAEDGDQHQGVDARSLHQPAGAREHGGARDPERLHRMPHGQEPGVGRREAAGVVAERPPEQAREAGRGVHRRAREPARIARPAAGARGRCR